MLGLLPALFVVEVGIMAVSWVLIGVLEEDMISSDIAIIVVVVVIVDNVIGVGIDTAAVKMKST